MKLLPAALACLTAALFTATASAQLKPPAAAPSATAALATQPAAGTAVNAEKQAAGALAAAGWLVLLDRRDWGRAWETSSSVFRGTIPLGTWMDAVPKLREPLGSMIERTQADAVYKTTLQGRPDGEYVSVIFDTKFQNKQVEETVTTVRDADGRWRVTGYSSR